MVDYYAILDVGPEANYEEIFKAYRRLAAKYHPDRGGSHEDMVRINEAWYILSDNERRRVYDQARSEHATTTQVQKFTEEANDARSHATEYPGTWAMFSKWLGGVQDDILKAQYNRTSDHPIFGAPTIDASVSGGLATLLGVTGLLGFTLSTGIVDPLFADLPKSLIFNGTGKPLLLYLIAGGAVGMWFGYWFHLGLRKLTPLLRNNALSRDKSKSPDKRVLRCNNCKKSLRVPNVEQTLVVTCPGCGNRFEAGGRKSPSKGNRRLDPIKITQGAVLTLGIGVFCLVGVVAGANKVLFRGLEFTTNEEAAAIRDAMLGSWSSSVHLRPEDLGEDGDDVLTGMTLSGITSYVRNGSCTFNGEILFHGFSDSGPDHASFTVQAEGTWSVEAGSDRDLIQYDFIDARVTPLNNSARHAAQEDPGALNDLRMSMLGASTEEILNLNEDEMRTKELESGIEVTSRRRP